jgi:hypothetical protein
VLGAPRSFSAHARGSGGARHPLPQPRFGVHLTSPVHLFLLAITIRSSGSAIGTFFLYLTVEQLLGQLAGVFGPMAGKIAGFAPNAVFKALWEPVRYGVIPFKPGQAPAIAIEWYLVAGISYITLFVLTAFLLYRRRDPWLPGAVHTTPTSPRATCERRRNPGGLRRRARLQSGELTAR